MSVNNRINANLWRVANVNANNLPTGIKNVLTGSVPPTQAPITPALYPAIYVNTTDKTIWYNVDGSTTWTQTLSAGGGGTPDTWTTYSTITGTSITLDLATQGPNVIITANIPLGFKINVINAGQYIKANNAGLIIRVISTGTETSNQVNSISVANTTTAGATSVYFIGNNQTTTSIGEWDFEVIQTGTNTFSAYVTQTPAITQLAGPPSGTFTASVGTLANTSAQINWTTPTSPGVPAATYAVTVLQGTTTVFTSSGLTGNTVSATGLTKNTAYTATVVASNASGSLTSNTVSFTTANINIAFVEQVFSNKIFTNPSTAAAQTVTTGIDLVNNTGMIWLKRRAQGTVTGAPLIFDTSRGVNLPINTTTSTNPTTLSSSLTAFNTNGFTIGTNANVNSSVSSMIADTFVTAPKFFDIVRYTGNGTTNRAIAHNLGVAPGMIIVKPLTTVSTSNMAVYHNTMNVGQTGTSVQKLYMLFNIQQIATPCASLWGLTGTNDASNFYVGIDGGVTDASTNVSGAQYIAYVFASSNAGGWGTSGTESIVATGGFSTDSGGGATISLPWEPQWVLLSRTGLLSTAAGIFEVYDTKRNMPWDTTQSVTTPAWRPNQSSNEIYSSYNLTQQRGFNTSGQQSSEQFIYLAIRKGPMAIPTVGSNVLDLSAGIIGGGGSLNVADINAANNADPDVFFHLQTSGTAQIKGFVSQLSGMGKQYNPGTYYSTETSNYFATNTTLGRQQFNDNTVFGQYANGWWLNNPSGFPNVAIHSFVRAPSFFEQLMYTGSGGSGNVSHNLGVQPQLIFLRPTDITTDWQAFYNFTSTTYQRSILNGNNNPTTLTYSSANDFSAIPTGTTLPFGASNLVVTNGRKYLTYMFGNCPGVSNFGTYTGTGADQTINCGFTTGARWVLIKGISGTTGAATNWYLFDAVRGFVVGGSNPYTILNTTAAQVTASACEPISTGFRALAGGASTVNVSGVTYIYMAIA